MECVLISRLCIHVYWHLLSNTRCSGSTSPLNGHSSPHQMPEPLNGFTAALLTARYVSNGRRCQTWRLWYQQTLLFSTLLYTHWSEHNSETARHSWEQRWVHLCQLSNQEGLIAHISKVSKASSDTLIYFRYMQELRNIIWQWRLLTGCLWCLPLLTLTHGFFIQQPCLFALKMSVSLKPRFVHTASKSFWRTSVLACLGAISKKKRDTPPTMSLMFVKQENVLISTLLSYS